MNKEQAMELSRELTKYIKGLDIKAIENEDLTKDIFIYIHDLGFINGGGKDENKKNNQSN